MRRGNRPLGSNPASVELQQLWFAMLRRRAWSSLVVVPADARTSVTSIARGLAAVGERHLGRRVALIIPDEVPTAERLLGSVMASPAFGGGAADLEPVMAERRRALPEAVESTIARVVSRHCSPLPADHGEVVDLTELSTTPGKVIVALESVVSNPFGIAVALAADAALLCVTLEETLMDSARRTVELIGPERFIGCAVVRRS